ncbi:MAG: MBL fold metallo-hydrolase [Luteolibacter sp.]
MVLVSCSKGLDPYSDLLVGEPAVSSPSKRSQEVTITYLGTNGYLIESGETSIVIDPYFSRIGMSSIILNYSMKPNQEEIESALKRANFPESIDAFLVTHAHFDHLLDVPPLQKQFGGKIVTSQTGKYLCEASGIPSDEIIAANHNQTYRFGKAKITVLEAAHDRICWHVPFSGHITEPLDGPPGHAKDWKVGTPFAFLIEISGKRIYVDSGGIEGQLANPVAKNADLAILGVAVRDSQKRFPEAVAAVNPRYVLPSHQDDFFLPFDRGFRFGITADFPRLFDSHRSLSHDSELILMDFFGRWVLR